MELDNGEERQQQVQRWQYAAMMVATPDLTTINSSGDWSSPVWAMDGGDGGYGVGNGSFEQDDGWHQYEVESNKTFLDTETLRSSLASFAFPIHLPTSTDTRPSTLASPTSAITLSNSTIDKEQAAASHIDIVYYHPDCESESGSSPRNSTSTAAIRAAATAAIAATTPTSASNYTTTTTTSFLLSRQTSVTTMRMSISATTSAAIDETNSVHPPSESNQRRHRPHQLELHRQFGTGGLNECDELELSPRELARGQTQVLPATSHADDRPRFLHPFDDFHLETETSPSCPDDASNRLLLDRRRPSSSRSHLRHWQQQQSPSLTPNAAKWSRVSPDGPSPPAVTNLPSMTMTREEFEALPPTIQRKYFSTLERLRFAVDPNPVQQLDPLSAGPSKSTPTKSHGTSKTLKRRRHHKAGSASESQIASPRCRLLISAADQRFYASLPDKIKRRHLTEQEQYFALCHRKSVMLDAADEALIKLGKRQSQAVLRRSPLPSPAFSDGETSTPSMHSSTSSRTVRESDNKAPDTFYDSFRWLEEEEDLDLRLFLDDYHMNLREDISDSSKLPRPSFRRHLSINKLPFGRPSLSSSRPEPKEALISPVLCSPTQASVQEAPLHTRRKSRGLSLMSPTTNKQSTQISPPPCIDTAAAHYQDPEARMKLRVYLASPQKFDEAIEFGFPSIEGGQNEEWVARCSESREQMSARSVKPRTFLQDDKSSIYSDEISMADPESPRTPDAFERPVPSHSGHTSTEPNHSTTKGDYASAPAMSREMTLRMTLTRPDLRANEDEIYGWHQQASEGQKPNQRDQSLLPPLVYGREGVSKESIERQFATFDQESNSHDNGVVKRIWNKVRRS